MRNTAANGAPCRKTLLTPVLLAIGTISPAAAQSAPECERWAVPAAVFVDSAGLLSPSLVFKGTSAFVVGTDRWPEDLREAEVRVASPVRPVAAPRHAGMEYILPVSGVTASGELVLIWAEPEDRERPARPGDRFASIYRSNLLSSGIRINGVPIYWSSPELVYRGRDIIWRGARESSVRIASDGTLHLAFPTLDKGVVYLRARDGADPSDQTRTITEFVGEQGLYADLAFGGGQDIYLAYIAGYSDGARSHSNSVFLRRSSDGGVSWADRVLIWSSGGREAHVVRAAVTPGGEVHLIWGRDITVGNGTLWHSMSSDEGASWTAPRQIAKPLRGNLGAFGIATDSAGTLHVAFTSYGSPGQDHLYYLRRKAGSWNSPCSIDPRFPLAHPVPAIATDRDGRVHLLWNRGSVKGDSAMVPVAVQSVLEPAE